MISVETLKELETLRARVEELEYEIGVLKATAEGEVACLMDYYDLTVSEARIIRALALARGAPLERVVLAEIIGQDVDYLRTIDSHIKRIRAKNSPTLPIDTIYGIGYRLIPQTAEAVRQIMAGNVVSVSHRTHFYRDGVAA